METVAILILLFAMRDPATRDTLNSVLAFYRENRDLITMLASSVSSAPGVSVAESSEKQENRPREEVGVNKILEEYLNGLK